MKLPHCSPRPFLALTSTLLTFACASPSFAGPNEGGTLIIHANPSLSYCEDVAAYCGQSGLSDCSQAITEHDGDASVVFFMIAAFPSAGSPRLAGVTFGIFYDQTHLTILDSGMCGDFELHTSGWPGPGEGNAVTWNTTQTDHLVEVYWFAAYNEPTPSPGIFTVTDHPVRGGGCCFGDDAVPANLDPILAYGALGFDQPGTLPCPDEDLVGACCLNCGCQMLNEILCTLHGGNFQGPGVSCDPNPCCPPPVGACCIACECTLLTQDECAAQGGQYRGDQTLCVTTICGTEHGACCFEGSCFNVTNCQCETLGGEFLGDNSNCDPYPCTPPSPALRETWGRVKGHYR